MNSVDRTLKSPGLLGGRGRVTDSAYRFHTCRDGAQMEWLWAGGKGQMQPSLEPQLPCYLFIVSLSPQSTPPLPSRPSVISTCPALPASSPAQGLQEEAPEGPQASLTSGGGIMVSQRVGAVGRVGGRGLGWRGWGWRCQSPINHAPLTLPV